MKHKLIVLAGAITIVLLTVLSLRSYDRYKANQQTKTHAAEVARQDAEVKRASEESTKKAKLQAACLSVKQAYDALPVANKAKAIAPNCDFTQL